MGLFGSMRDRLREFWRRRCVNHLSYARKGARVRLFNGSVFHPPEKIAFDDDVYVGPDACFWADGGITLHSNVILGPRVTIFTSNHKIEGAEFLPYGPDSEFAPVEIFSHVWIGGHSIILPGVRIGEGAVVGAGSVVARDVPPLAFVAGNPARVRSYRDPEHYRRIKAEGKFYLRAKSEQLLTPRWMERPDIDGTMRHTPEALADRRRLGLDDAEDFEGPACKPEKES